MVTFLCFLKEENIFVELLFRWESDSINTLERVVLGVGKPVGRGVLKDFESLNVLSTRYVRSSA
jgi:hypothetical protein